MEDPLAQLHQEIDARARAIRGLRPDWPCARGCDACCRRLADLPRLTAAEWALLREGLSALPTERLRQVRSAAAALGPAPVRPVVCPLLDGASGACLTYAHRPVACRIYGFYVERGLGLYCRELERRVAEGAMDGVVWGNGEAMERRLGAMGESRSLAEWLAKRS